MRRQDRAECMYFFLHNIYVTCNYILYIQQNIKIKYIVLRKLNN